MTPPAKRRSKGDGSIYQRASDGRWFGAVDLTTPGGGRKRRTVSAKTLRELRPKMRALQKRTEAGATGDGTQTTGAWLTYWLDEISDARDSTKKTYRGYIKNWLSPDLGRARLTDLSPEHVRSLMSHMEREGKSPATRRQVLSILSKALDVAHREGKVDRNVCDTVARPSLANQKTHGVLTMQQVAKLWPRLMEHPNRARWMAALVLGIRQGEALGLAWDDVHLDDDEPWLWIRQSQQAGTTRLGALKSAASDRQIPIPEPVLSAMVEWRAQSGGDGLVWGPLEGWADYDEWHRLLKSAGVPLVPVHAARATAATVLDRMGATPRQVADILGQATVAVGQKHYVHSERDDLRTVLSRSAAEISGPNG